jgi:hypothetical protein
MLFKKLRVAGLPSQSIFTAFNSTQYNLPGFVNYSETITWWHINAFKPFLMPFHQHRLVIGMSNI